MARAVLKRKPVAYWQQRRKECGAYVMKALLSMYEKDGNEPPSHYLSFFSNLFWGYTWPRRIKKVLAQHGLQADFRRAARPRKGRFDLLKAHLLKQEPVIVLVGNGFNANKKYRHFRRWFRHHWVLLMGFDDAKGCVYLYDPRLHQSKHEDVPVGNVSMSYRVFMKQWRGVFLTGIVNYIYMPVCDVKTSS